MNAKEIIMIAARMEFVQIHRDHTTATVPEGIAVMVGIVQVLIRSSHLYVLIHKHGLAQNYTDRDLFESIVFK